MKKWVCASRGCHWPVNVEADICEECAINGTPAQQRKDAKKLARKAKDPGDEDVERVARALQDEETHEGLLVRGHNKEGWEALARAALAAMREGVDRGMVEREAFQGRVKPWLLACFGEMIAGDREERNHRFLEEALELVQACGCTAHEAHQLVDYVYGRDVGDPPQEVGGVMVTLAALCLANGLDMHQNGKTELARIWTKVEAIRAKQAAKPKHSPLPEQPR